MRPHCTYERTCACTPSGPSDCPLSVPCCPLSTCSSALQRPPWIALPIPLAAASYSATFRKSSQAAWNFSRPRNGDRLHVTRQTVWLVFHENRKVHMRSILCCVFVKLSRQLGDPRKFDFLKALKTLSQVKQGRSSRITTILWTKAGLHFNQICN